MSAAPFCALRQSFSYSFSTAESGILPALLGALIRPTADPV